MDIEKMDKFIDSRGKKVRVYFIGFCTLFLVTFVSTWTIHYFFSALIAFIFVGFLLVYYMQIYTFIRTLRVIQTNGLSPEDLGLKVGIVQLKDNDGPGI